MLPRPSPIPEARAVLEELSASSKERGRIGAISRNGSQDQQGSECLSLSFPVPATWVLVRSVELIVDS